MANIFSQCGPFGIPLTDQLQRNAKLNAAFDQTQWLGVKQNGCSPPPGRLPVWPPRSGFAPLYPVFDKLPEQVLGCEQLADVPFIQNSSYYRPSPLIVPPGCVLPAVEVKTPCPEPVQSVQVPCTSSESSNRPSINIVAQNNTSVVPNQVNNNADHTNISGHHNVLVKLGSPNNQNIQNNQKNTNAPVNVQNSRNVQVTENVQNIQEIHEEVQNNFILSPDVLSDLSNLSNGFNSSAVPPGFNVATAVPCIVNSVKGIHYDLQNWSQLPVQGSMFSKLGFVFGRDDRPTYIFILIVSFLLLVLIVYFIFVAIGKSCGKSTKSVYF